MRKDSSNTPVPEARLDPSYQVDNLNSAFYEHLTLALQRALAVSRGYDMRKLWR